MTWFKTNDASISNGGTVVAIGDGANTSVVKAGDALIIGSFQPVEVKAVFSGQIELADAWNNSTQSGVAATAMPTSGDFKSATEALRNATKITQDNYKVIQDWGKETGTVTFVDYEGNEYETKTMQEMESVFDASLSQREQDFDALLATSHPHWPTNHSIEAQRARNISHYLASGMIDMGKHHVGGDPVNEGLWLPFGAIVDEANTFCVGRGVGNSNIGGNSVSHTAKVHMAGFVTNLRYLNTNADYALFKLPPAPDGTISTNLLTGQVIDHKTHGHGRYDGQVAADTNEAAVRCWEGVIENGDFRLGTQAWAGSGGGTMTVVENGIQIDATSGGHGMVQTEKFTQAGIDLTSGAKTLTVEIYIKGADGARPYMQIGSTVSGGERYYLKEGHNKFQIKTNGTETDRVYILSYAAGTYTVGSVSVRLREDVVIKSPEDVAGLEGWLEEVSATNPYAYPNGLPQNKATFWDGISLSESSRPASYYAVFDGDEGSRGMGVNFHALSVIEQDAFMLNPDNNMFMWNGRVYQWRVRQRSVRGMSNEAWKNHDANTDDGSAESLLMSQGQQSRVTMQGLADKPSTNFGSNFYAQTKYATYNDTPHKGLFTGRSSNAHNFSENSEIYWLTVASCPRLNMGVYHPSLNPFGTASTTGDNGGLVAGGGWRSADNTNVMHCAGHLFRQYDVNRPYEGHGRYHDTGSRASSSSLKAGRQDGRFHDALYSGGMNGIIDYRLPVRPGSHTANFARQVLDLKDGTARGLDTLYLSRAYDDFWESSDHNNNVWKYLWNYSSGSTTVYCDCAHLDIQEGDKIIVEDRGRKLRFIMDVNDGVGQSYARGITADARLLYDADGIGGDSVHGEEADDIQIIHMKNLGIRVSGLSAVMDVYSRAENLVTDSDLQLGWVGNWWTPTTNNTAAAELQRKNLTGDEVDILSQLYRGADTNNVWETSGTEDRVDSTTNIGEFNIDPINYIYAYEYETKAKPTEKAWRGKLYAAKVSIGDVMYLTDRYAGYGCLLVESLIGKVASGNSGQATCRDISLSEYRIINDTVYGTAPPVHDVYSLLSESATSKYGVKVLAAETSDNDQMFVELMFNELILGTDWGDDGKIHLSSNEAYRTDLNGESCLYGTHRTALPYAWAPKEY